MILQGTCGDAMAVHAGTARVQRAAGNNGAARAGDPQDGEGSFQDLLGKAAGDGSNGRAPGKIAAGDTGTASTEASRDAVSSKTRDDAAVKGEAGSRECGNGAGQAATLHPMQQEGNDPADAAETASASVVLLRHAGSRSEPDHRLTSLRRPSEAAETEPAAKTVDALLLAAVGAPASVPIPAPLTESPSEPVPDATQATETAAAVSGVPVRDGASLQPRPLQPGPQQPVPLQQGLPAIERRGGFAAEWNGPQDSKAAAVQVGQDDPFDAASAEATGATADQSASGMPEAAAAGRTAVTLREGTAPDVSAAGESAGQEAAHIARAGPKQAGGQFSREIQTVRGGRTQHGRAGGATEIATAGGSVAESTEVEKQGAFRVETVAHGAMDAAPPSSSGAVPQPAVAEPRVVGTPSVELPGSRSTPEHASPGEARIEFGIKDSSLGDLRVQATLDSSGAMYIEVAGHREGADAVLDQITPLLHAAVVEQVDGHGLGRSVHVTAAADAFALAGGGTEPITGSGATAVPQSSSLLSSLFQQAQQQPSQQRRREAVLRTGVAASSAAAGAAAATPRNQTALFRNRAGSSSGLSVRI